MSDRWEAAKDVARHRLLRRTFLGNTGVGLGAAALHHLLGQDRLVASDRPALGGLPGLPHFAPKAKHVIFLCMAGGPSHLETFDYKPKLAAMHGKPMPQSITAGQPIAQLQGKRLRIQGPMTKFRRYGRNGLWVSDFLPWQAKMADDLCVIRSMVTEQINHDPAHTFMNTGTAISGRPSMGSWVLYGLGSECENLPGFVVMTSVGGRNPQPIASRQWSAGFLPSRYQGVEFNAAGPPVHYVDNPPGVSHASQRRVVEAVRSLDDYHLRQRRDPELETRIAAYELAFQMQTSVPELTDMRDEPQSVLDMYGAKPGDGSFASNCLLARRLVERGVRFVHLYHRGWDHHGDLVRYMKICAGLTDRPAWALVQDLKRRGLLDETLVIWGGEFGRTPMFQGKGGPGRDHHIKGFSMWMAGGGVRGGMAYGATDEFGYHAVEQVVHIRDLHATMLHLLGVDHKRLTFRFSSRDMRLTDVHGRVIRKWLA